MPIPLAYFITFRTYSTWLNGDQRGSVDHYNNAYGMPVLPPDNVREREAERRAKQSPVTLNTAMRTIVEQSIRGVCEYRNWSLYALNIRTNHVHSVVYADEAPEKVMTDFKAYSTRKITEAGIWKRGDKCWLRHGSTIYLWTEKSIACACEYVMNGQGDALPKFKEWQ